MAAHLRTASDVGGTFTDIVCYEVDPRSGQGTIRTAKVDTTPPSFDDGVMASLRKLDVDPATLGFFAHGSTVVINALTERKGVTTALITTRGFRDVLEIGRGNRPDLFNFNFRKPAPFVERYLRAELEERTTYKGELRQLVDLGPLPHILQQFRTWQVEAIAVCFLHAYLNPINEQRTATRIRELWPEISVLTSHEISREWREYERTSTTVLSAYVHPIARRYIESLEGRLVQGGFAGRPYIMQSNGGIATVAAAKSNPISMVESGPASGIHAAAHLGRAIGEPNLIVLDIGGTTAKCALVERGEVRVTTEYHIEKDRKSPGYPIQTPVTEIVEIGNGGGSIAWIDDGGKLHVGPQSAGAMPGPAAYGRGGMQPTTTDANLLLGRIDPASFAGGEIEPDMAALHAAFAPLAERLSLSLIETARGVIRIANANMTNALRLISTNRGYDPREFALIAFGGGGPMHAVALAEELKVPKVIVPVNSAVFSAWGMLLTDLRRDYLQTRLLSLQSQNSATIHDVFGELRTRAVDDYRLDGVSVDDQPPLFEYHADLRYQGQEHTVKVALSPQTTGTFDFDEVARRFHEAHERRFTYRLDNPIQLVNFHLVAKVPVPRPELVKKAVSGRTLADARLPARRVDFDRYGVHDSAIYDGLKLEPGMRLRGPAIVQEPAVTLVVPPPHEVVVDDYGNYHVYLRSAATA